jgi:hypothetical protein
MRISIATPSPSSAGTIKALKIPAIIGHLLPVEQVARLGGSGLMHSGRGVRRTFPPYLPALGISR